MGYQMGNGKFADVDEVVLLDVTDASASSDGPIFETDRGTLRATLTVADESDAATVDVDIETSEDGSTWRDVSSFTQATEDGSERMCFSGLDRYVRAEFTYGGTGTVSVRVAGEFV